MGAIFMVLRTFQVLVHILFLIQDTESYTLPSPSQLQKHKINHHHHVHRQRHKSFLLPSSTFLSLSSSVNGDFVDDPLASQSTGSSESDNDNDEEQQRQLSHRRNRLKFDLLQLGSGYDRGFGATSRAIDAAMNCIEGLELINPEFDAARGVDGNSRNSRNSNPSDENNRPPLEGSWRVVWTTASDVLVLGANPLVIVGAIYQVFGPLPVVTNVIDLLPRVQNLFSVPTTNLFGGIGGGGRPDSVLRIEVTTRASSRTSKPMRVGLVFERVKLSVKILFGNTNLANFFPPLEFDLPRATAPELANIISSLVSAISSTDGGGDGSGDDRSNDIGFFDVTYLDDDLLIIKQNAPGGLFVLSKVDNFDP